MLAESVRSRAGGEIASEVVVGFRNWKEGGDTAPALLRKMAKGIRPSRPDAAGRVLDARLNRWLGWLEGVVLDQKIRAGRQMVELQNGQRVFQSLMLPVIWRGLNLCQWAVVCRSQGEPICSLAVIRMAGRPARRSAGGDHG